MLRNAVMLKEQRSYEQVSDIEEGRKCWAKTQDI